MPPKPKCTKEQIIDTAFEMVRKEGLEVLTARSIAVNLGTSTAPIFTLFSSIGEIEQEVIKKVSSLYNKYIQEGLNMTPKFKGVGIKYIEFAKDEPELFKILIRHSSKNNKTEHFLPSTDANSPQVLTVLEETYGLSENVAQRLYNHMSVYALGFASLYAQNINIFTMDDISRMISEVFIAIINNEKSEDTTILRDKLKQ